MEQQTPFPIRYSRLKRIASAMAISKSEHTDPHYQAWKKVSDGHWERPLTGFETYFAFCSNLTFTHFGGQYQYIISSTIKIKQSEGNQINVGDLQEAWKYVLFQQPKLAATIDSQDWTLHYRIPSASDLKDWLSTTFVVHGNTTAEKLYSKLPTINHGSLYWLPESSELILRCPHWQVDGRGSWLFWDAFFTAYNNVSSVSESLQWGQEVTNLAPAMSEIWNLKQPTAEQFQASQAVFMKWLGNLPGIGPAAMNKTPGKPQRLELELDQSKTASLVAAAKKRGFTATIVVHAAFVLANVKHTQEQPDGTRPSKYVSLAEIDLRGRLGGSYTSSLAAINDYFASLPLLAEVGSFNETAKSLKAGYDEAKQMGEEEMFTYFEFLAKAAQSPEFLAGPIPGDGVVTSLGIVEKIIKRSYGSIEIVDLHAGIDLVLGFGMVFVYTFDGRLRMSYCYNDGTQDTALIKSILETTREILEKELVL